MQRMIYISFSVPRLAFSLALFIACANAHAVSLSQLKGLGSFQRVALAVAMVNQSMRVAALNPMDKWRRNNVRNAMMMLPPAVAGLAGDFKAGKLHNGDLKFVQGILGGYVDVTAPDIYDQFLKKPSSDLIPKLPGNFPQEYLAQAKTELADIGASVGNSSQGEALRNSDRPLQAPMDVLDLNSVPAGVADVGKTQGTTSTVYRDESQPLSFAQQLEADVSQAETKAAANETTTTSVVTSVRDSSNEAETAPFGAFGSAAPPTPVGKETVEEAVPVRILSSAPKKPLLDKDFFLLKKRNKKKAKLSQVEKFEINIRPQYWRMPGVALFSIFVKPAAAESEQSGCQSGNCGSGGGGEGGEGGGKGELAAAALMAVATALSAIIPAVVQADADKKIAKINADAQIKMTEITSETSKHMAENQKKIAEQQAQITKELADNNNKNQSERLDKQLAALKEQRDQKIAIEKEQRSYDRALAQEQIKLARETAQQKVELAKQQYNAQITQAGLSQGYTTANTQNRVTVNRIRGQIAATTGVASSATNATNSMGLSGSGLASSGLSKEFQAMPGKGITGQALSNRLLESLGDDEMVYDPKTKKRVKKNFKKNTKQGLVFSSLGSQGNRGMRSQRGVRGMAAMTGISRAAFGSTAEEKMVFASVKAPIRRNDLSNFAANGDVPTTTFAESLNQRRSTTRAAETSAHSETANRSGRGIGIPSGLYGVSASGF